MAALRDQADRATLEGYARYGIEATGALGVPMAAIKRIGKELGRDHDLADELWRTGCYEARLLVAFVACPERLTLSQMDSWARDFDNWALCDTLCFQLFDRTPHAWRKVDVWARRRQEFVKRAAFALLASLALHDKQADDRQFLDRLALIDKAASDERNFVKKGVSWALRSIGRRPTLLSAATDLATRLADSDDATERWIGKDALRDLGKRR